ncbi:MULTISPECIES: DUF4168 domain-containing protein [unclassified Ensifer]|nr:MULTISPECIES: DUF4168 domain-containing protein [unclassified Ensifer]MDP9634441.1 putative membrane protein YqiK [Ensifer adhaerens]OMQ43251.1 hypothetical protein BKP54_19470 [Ensifer sp. 1H6]PSS65077.1 hypothetical protein C6558_11355 [Ensifer sp. NM-2]
MINRYALIASLTATLVSFTAFSPASALEMAQAQETQPTQGQAGKGTDAISDQKIQAFAVAYLQVDKVRQAYSAKIEATTDAAAKEKLQTEASKQMVEAVESSSAISVEEYSSILTAAQNDPALAKKVQEKIQTTPPAQQ